MANVEKRVPKNDIRFKVSLTAEQKLAKEMILKNKITVLSGIAGTSKTFTAVQTALDMFFKREVNRITIMRPTVASEDIGHLPGPQPLSAKILTPEGWTTMGEIKIGDLVLGPDGNYYPVTKVIDNGVQKIYKITTTSNQETLASEHHLWTTKPADIRKNKIQHCLTSTKEIMESLISKDGRFNHELPESKPVEFNTDYDLIIPPYTLGALIGDGGLSDCGKIRFYNTPSDEEIRVRMENEISKYGVIVRRNGKSPLVCDLVSIDPEIQFNRTNRNPIRQEIENLKLNCKAEYKFIPEIYKRASIKDREALLQGLIDTDGSVHHNSGTPCYYTSSEQLANDVCEIARSLGCRAFVSKNENNVGEIIKISDNYGRINFPQYAVNISNIPDEISPAFLKRKLKNVKRASDIKQKPRLCIKSVEFVKEEECRCIVIDSNDHLYITDDYIVTHNSVEEKMGMWMIPIIENMYILYDKVKIDKMISDGDIRMLPLQFTQGITFVNEFVILDEAQNATVEQTSMVLTRLGKGSRMVFTGDYRQIQLKNKASSGFKKLIDLDDKIDTLGHVELLINHRDPIIEQIVKMYNI